MCGEKSPLGPCGPVSPGSPPRMRGKGNLKIALVLGVGITPAHAGKRDSPRPDRPSAGGSPPHMRGKGVGAAFRAILGGITPAHAGKSGSHCSRNFSDWDHPRTCGEKQSFAGKPLPRLGSPPHMRGKASASHNDSQCQWITPAHAGKRLKRSRSIVPHAAIVPLFPSVCNKPAGSDGSPAGHDAPPFLPIENAVPASPAYNLRSL